MSNVVGAAILQLQPCYNTVLHWNRSTKQTHFTKMWQNTWKWHCGCFSGNLSSSCVVLCLPLGISCQSEEGWKPEGHLGAAWPVSESRQPADDHADQSQEATW